MDAHVYQMLVLYEHLGRTLVYCRFPHLLCCKAVQTEYRLGLTSIPAHTRGDDAQKEWLVGIV